MPVAPTFDTVDLTAHGEPSKPKKTYSLVQLLSRPFAKGLAALRRSAAERRLRDQLAGMDDALLRDIGIAEDEIYRIRARERFTPEAWSDQAACPPRRNL